MIKLLLSDVDGVMTDGSVAYDANGVETKTFNIRDGLGIKLWQRTGFEFGIVTGRDSAIVAQRSAELGIGIVVQGAGVKMPVVERIAGEQGVTLDEIAYVGDDLPDLPVIRAVGCGAAVADAAAEVKAGADIVLETPGGRGAVREFIEKLLREAGKWDALIKTF
ncbi:MAG: HAD hydrolase family protein [Planctomycetota bacterium]